MPLRRAFAFALLLAPAPIVAQTFQPVQVSDADALAEQMRRLGANSLDLDALLTAGELSVQLDDLSAAGAFFARAEKIDPRNGRAKAGEGAILVRAERPGESLRYFAQAEQLGWTPTRFASDRGLAYDLLGDPGRAQRDYKLALSGRDDPEARRRYALSLGIAGRQAQALDELAPLVRQNDRAAWRARAFILAMGGNAAEASRIAQTMMPPGAAAGLQSFFTELPRLPAIDRAFAVHFGELHPTPQRLADARVAPVQAPLALDPLPVQVVAVVTPLKKGKRDKRTRDEIVALVPVPRPIAAALPLPPAYQAPGYVALAATTPLRDRPLTPGEQASLAAASMRTSRSSRPNRRGYTAAVAMRGLTATEQANLASAGGRTGSRPVVLATVPVAVVPPARAPIVASAAPGPAAMEFGVRTSPIAIASVQPRYETAPVPGLTSLPAKALSTPSLAMSGLGTSPPSTAIASVVLGRDGVPTPGFSATSVVSGRSGLPIAPQPTSAPDAVLATVGPVPNQTAVPGSSVLPPSTDLAVAALASPSTGAVLSAVPTLPPATVSAAVLPGSALMTQVPLSPAPIASAPSGGQVAPANPPVAIAAIAGTDAGTGAVTTAAVPTVETPPPVTAIDAAQAPALPSAALLTAAPLAPLPAPIAVTRAPVRRARGGRGDADTMLARIVAGLTIPAAELDVGGPARAAPGEGKPLTGRERHAAARQSTAEVTADKPVDASVTARKALADKKASAEKKTLADRKAPAEKKAVAEKKALADQEAADAKIERAQPRRIWVQVAGGANEGDLAKAWRATRAKAPAALIGRQGYATPLRGTNRVLTGPFKTDAEARAYVNQLAKAGVSAFTFTSDAGQKITKLDTK